MANLTYNFLIAFSVLTFLSGCAPGTLSISFKTDVADTSKIDTSDAVIKVRRPSSVSWGPLSLCIHDANNPIGILGGNGGELIWKRPPGYMAIVVDAIVLPYQENPTSVAIFKVEAGKTYSFNLDIKSFGKPAIKPDNADNYPIIYEMTSDSGWPTVKPINDDWRTKLSSLESLDNNSNNEANLNLKYATPKLEFPNDYKKLAQDWFEKYGRSDLPLKKSIRSINQVSNPRLSHVSNRWGWITQVIVVDGQNVQWLPPYTENIYMLLIINNAVVGYKLDCIDEVNIAHILKSSNDNILDSSRPASCGYAEIHDKWIFIDK